MSETTVICYLCGETAPLNTATHFWNLELPVSDYEDEQTLYPACISCYRKILLYIEEQHSQRVKDGCS